MKFKAVLSMILISSMTLAPSVFADKPSVTDMITAEPLPVPVTQVKDEPETEPGEELEAVILKAKELFAIEGEYDFTYSLNSRNNQMLWYLNWSSKDGLSPDISVRINAQGLVYTYRHNVLDSSYEKKLPKISKEDAILYAKEFLQRVNPSIYDEIQYKERSGAGSLTSPNYNLNFYRIENGIPCYDDSMNISVDKDTGRVVNFNMNWTVDLIFPEPANILDDFQAMEKYKENMGLELLYKSYIDNKDISIFSVYSPVYSSYSYGIDAFTGERIELEGMLYRAGSGVDTVAVSKEMDGGSLSPEELNEVNSTKNLITKEQVEQLARDTGILGITGEYELSYANLNKVAYRNKYLWSIEFEKAVKEDGEEDYGSVSASVDAETGEFESFYIGYPREDAEGSAISREESKEKVEDFLKEFVSDKYELTRYNSRQEESIIVTDKNPDRQSFEYQRFFEGVKYPQNSINVRFDAVNQKIYSYNITWYDTVFPSVKNALAEEEAYNKLFENIGIELKYVITYPESEESNIQPLPQVVLAYVLKENNSTDLDPETGILVDYRGQEYIEPGTVSYTDLEDGEMKDKIQILAEYGIYLDGKQFAPDTLIKQIDLLKLMSQVMDRYYGPVITGESSQDDINSLYRLMIAEGVITEEEKMPYEAVSRENAVKYFINVLDYAEIARIPGIYVCDYEDKDDISPGLVGYVVLGKGLGIVKDTDAKFRPKDSLTRLESISLIYNYLTR